MCEKDSSWNPTAYACENSKHLKSVADTSVTKCDEILIFIHNFSTKMTNTAKTSVMSNASINCHSKKVRECFILHTVLLAIILFLIITVICYNYAEQKSVIQNGN